MTLTQIQYVLAVAETGTISAAAKRLFIAQPSLTASIKELENELQVTLFRRTNKGVTLTPEGEEFLGYARQVNSQLDLMRERYFGGAPVRRRFWRFHAALFVRSGGLRGAFKGARRRNVRFSPA